ncbi:MAG: MATE family efflux transporter [Phycisphaeraceae bacterium]
MTREPENPKPPAPPDPEKDEAVIQDAPPSEIPVRRPVAPQQRELTGKLAGLSLPRQVLVLATWPFLEHALNVAVSWVDMALAGRLGEQAVPATNAMAITGMIGWLMGLLMMAIGVGSTALIARAIGGRHRRVARAAVGQSLIMASAVGLVIAFVLFFGSPWLGAAFGLEGEALELCVIYLRVLAPAAPMTGLLFIGGACLRGAGDTRTPFRAMVAVNVVNVSISVTLVFGPEPLGGWGIGGIAAGTSVGWAVGAVLLVSLLLSPGAAVQLFVHRLRPHVHTMKRIIRVGIPNLIESSGQWIGNAVIVSFVGGLAAEAALGAHMIAIRIEAMSFLPGAAVGTAAATLAGQYLGLGDPHRAKKAVSLCWGLGAGIMLLMGFAFIFIPEPLVRIMTNEPELLETAPPLLRIAGPVQVFFGSYMVLAQALRGAGDTTTAMLMTYASTFLIRVPAAYLLGVHLGYGLIGIWLALCGELVVRGSIFAARFLQGGWTKVKV